MAYAAHSKIFEIMDEQELSKIAQLIKTAEERWPYTLHLVNYQSKLCFARYKALRDNGFDRIDSLQLCVKNVELQ